MRGKRHSKTKTDTRYNGILKFPSLLYCPLFEWQKQQVDSLAMSVCLSFSLPIFIASNLHLFLVFLFLKWKEKYKSWSNWLNLMYTALLFSRFLQTFHSFSWSSCEFLLRRETNTSESKKCLCANHFRRKYHETKNSSVLCSASNGLPPTGILLLFLSFFRIFQSTLMPVFGILFLWAKSYFCLSLTLMTQVKTRDPVPNEGAVNDVSDCKWNEKKSTGDETCLRSHSLLPSPCFMPFWWESEKPCVKG